MNKSFSIPEKLVIDTVTLPDFPRIVREVLADDNRDFTTFLDNSPVPESFTIVEFIEMVGKEIDSRENVISDEYLRIYEKALYLIKKGFDYTQRLSEVDELREYLEKQYNALFKSKGKDVLVSLSLKESLAETALDLLIDTTN